MAHMWRRARAGIGQERGETVNRKQSIISLLAVLAVYVCSHLGIALEEDAAVEVFTAAAGLAAVVWGVVVDHRFKEPKVDEWEELEDGEVL